MRNANAAIGRAVQLGTRDEFALGPVRHQHPLGRGPSVPAVAHVMPLARRDISARLSQRAAAAIFIAAAGAAPVPALEAIAALFGLTAAEKRVAGHVAAGLTRKEIAAAGGVSDGTIKSQLATIFDKTGTGDQRGARTADARIDATAALTLTWFLPSSACRSYSSVGICRYIDWMPTRPGPVKRLTMKFMLAPKKPLDRRSILVSIRTEASLYSQPPGSMSIGLAGGQRLLEDIAVAVQPDDAVAAIAAKTVDEEAALAKQHRRQAAHALECVVDVAGGGEKLVFAHLDLLAAPEMDRYDVAGRRRG